MHELIINHWAFSPLIVIPDIFTFIFLVVVALISAWNMRSSYRVSADKNDEENFNQLQNSSASVVFDDSGNLLVYEGAGLNFNDEMIESILLKRFSYYKKLNSQDRGKFVSRLKEFIADKTFTIHDKSGFREMPILISACAIQLTFGLEKYLLPWFKFIHIYPAEFLGIYPTIRYLVGNVSGNTINIGWKYFMEGIEHPADGKNLGLHEMSHALYYQTFVVEENVDRDFKRTFNEFTLVGDQVYTSNKEKQQGLYSPYALKNFQEFWAESVELFFERPVEMKLTYPGLYFSMKELLNQTTV